MKKYYFICIFIFFVSFFNTFANNIQITNVFTSDRNPTSDYTYINFTVSWSNSWRTTTLESNWDAAWIFCKIRKKFTTTWFHATINYAGTGDAASCGHSEVAGSTIITPSDGKGVFVYRSITNAGIGNVNFSGEKIRWNYGIDGIADNDEFEICVFAIEMVYVLQGSFYLGDGGSGTGRFRKGTTTNTPFQINSESGLLIGDDADTKLYATASIGLNAAISDNFPKGFKAFYCMKYEINQQQYVDFLNKLTRTQQATRSANNTAGVFINTNTTSPVSRNGIRVQSDPGGVNPRVYACDLNANAVYDQTNDGQYIACNYLNYQDGQAYADWTGLRPITELEFEKACRGTMLPVADEYPWGNTNITGASGISNTNTSTEVASNISLGANICYNNHTNVQGPLRAGSFASASSTRQTSGGTYYGILDMGGNLYERVITINGDATIIWGRAFTGLNGDGSLDVNGNSNVTNWPSDPRGYSLRGSCWNNTFQYCTISDRNYTSWNDGNRYNFLGFRCGRTAP